MSFLLRYLQNEELPIDRQVTVTEILAGATDAQTIFCKSIKERGYAIIHVDKESTREALTNYEAALATYFTHSLEEKQKNAEKDNNNLGYVKGDFREYIKVSLEDRPFLMFQLRPTDPEELWPCEGDEKPFKSAYENMFGEYSAFAFKIFELLATYIDEGCTIQFIDPGIIQNLFCTS